MVSRDDCGADCGVCDVCEVSGPETITPAQAVGRGADFYGSLNHLSTPVRVTIISHDGQHDGVNLFTVRLCDGSRNVADVRMECLDPDQTPAFVDDGTEARRQRLLAMRDVEQRRSRS